jgi:hypothetical protein
MYIDRDMYKGDTIWCVYPHHSSLRECFSAVIVDFDGTDNYSPNNFVLVRREHSVEKEFQISGRFCFKTEKLALKFLIKSFEQEIERLQLSIKPVRERLVEIENSEPKQR